MSIPNFPRAALSAVRVAGLSIFAVMLFLGTALVFAAVIAWITSSPLTSPIIIGCGVVCGLSVWLFVFVFHTKKETIKISLPADEKQVQQLKTVMETLGYEVKTLSPAKVIGRPVFGAFLFGGAVHASWSDSDFELTGPKVSLERIRHQLRMENHLNTHWDILLENTPTSQDDRLRGVNLRFQILEQNDSAIVSEVLESLKDKGANVSCAVNLWAQFEDGVSKSDMEELVSQLLKSKGVNVNMHAKAMLSTKNENAGIIPSEPMLHIPVAG